jgi:hypothetical protein
MDLGVVHPVPLPVHHVVPEFHVLDDLGQPERGGPQQPQRSAVAAEQHDPPGEFEEALQLDRPV